AVEVAINDVVEGASGAAHDEGPEGEQAGEGEAGADRQRRIGGPGQRRAPPAGEEQQPGADRPVEAGQAGVRHQPFGHEPVDPAVSRNVARANLGHLRIQSAPACAGLRETMMGEGSSREAYPRSRLYVEAALAAAARVELDRDQSHYLLRVMRLDQGAEVALFNGRDGEWTARIVETGKRGCMVEVERLRRRQSPPSDLWLLFAPVKRQPLDWMVQKATELGVGVLQPIMTQRTVVDRVNLARLRSIAIEAAEQSERLDLPELREPERLSKALESWPHERRLALCDETGRGTPVAAAFAGAARGPWGLSLGPEGGFARAGLDALRDLAFVTPVGLGPRVLRAEAAAVAVLAVWQAMLGDWSEAPPRRDGE